MICIDNDAAIAAFQSNPPANIAVHPDRVRAFLLANSDQRLMFPAVALSEYLWAADRAELETGIRRVVGERMFAPAFDEVTAEIAAQLGRDYAAGRKLGDVAKQTGHHRIALKADLLIVATALQHSARIFLTGDPGCLVVARFAKLDATLISTLPEPSPERQFPPVPPPSGKQKGLFDDSSDDPS